MSEQKYHVNKFTGRPAPCDAQLRECPVGGAHFTSEKDAQKAIDHRNEKMFGATQLPLKRKKKSGTPAKDALDSAVKEIRGLHTDLARAQEKIDSIKSEQGGNFSARQVRLGLAEGQHEAIEVNLENANHALSGLRQAVEEEDIRLNPTRFKTYDEGKRRLDFVDNRIMLFHENMEKIEDQAEVDCNDQQLEAFSNNWHVLKNESDELEKVRYKIAKKLESKN